MREREKPQTLALIKQRHPEEASTHRQRPSPFSAKHVSESGSVLPTRPNMAVGTYTYTQHMSSYTTLLTFTYLLENSAGHSRLTPPPCCADDSQACPSSLHCSGDRDTLVSSLPIAPWPIKNRLKRAMYYECCIINWNNLDVLRTNSKSQLTSLHSTWTDHGHHIRTWSRLADHQLINCSMRL